MVDNSSKINEYNRMYEEKILSSFIGIDQDKFS